MTIVRDRDRTAVVVSDEYALFRLAVHRYLLQADGDRNPAESRVDQDWSFRSMGMVQAASILRFCAFMGVRLDCGRDVEDLYRAALAELRPCGDAHPARDRLAEVTATHRLVRSLRTAGKLDEALRLSTRLGPDFFYASGAEPRFADLQFEIGACLLEMGRPAQVFSALGELEKTYWETSAARSYSTRHRHDFILALAEQGRAEQGAAIDRMEAALGHLTTHRISDTRHDVYELSLTLTYAEMLADSEAHHHRAIELAELALGIAERIRGRWGVIARARTPLSRAFRRVYGDVALLTARLPGASAARLGLRVCLSAKQTGFAGHLRAGELLLAPRLRGLMAEVLAVEQAESSDLVGDDEALRDNRRKQERMLAELHERILKRVNPMLADMILPTPTDVSDLLRVVGDRHALDFAGLPDTLGGGTNWFRTLTTPDGHVQFERFRPGPHFADYFHGLDGRRAWVDRLDEAREHHRPDWHALALEILPAELIRRLRDTASTDEPIELLVSAHQELSLLPWAALEIDSGGTLLLHHAVITQTPVLTCLSRPHPPFVSGPALVRLVAEGAVWIDRERGAWGLPATGGSVPLSRCPLQGEAPRTMARSRLSAELINPEEQWRFIHVAAHGGGTGLDQHLRLPEETATAGSLTAAYALALRWPESALMASCHIGRLVNVEDAEPLGFVMAVLTGGSQCVVAAIDRVPNLPAGRMAGHLVRLVRGGSVRLDHALRRAQLKLARTEHVVSWALFNTYVR
ncbi:CHAT domain-containing protein [Micromonospora sp. NPDC002389]|uniref:CHAT domain-containing protein n=1 Tax=Micromonospora sp. NPDC002389 TaxID=3154272 RepID=UPI00332629F9